MKTRIISGIVLAAAGAAALVLGGAVLLGVLLFCSIIGMYELYRALGVCKAEKPLNPLTVTSYILAAAYDLLVYYLGGGYAGVFVLLAVIILMITYVILFPGFRASQAVSAVFGFIYVNVMLNCIMLIRMNPEDGKILVWLVFISAWGADTFAYFTGRFLGRHKMAPVLSPKKTIEGAVGGIAGAAVLGVVLAAVIRRNDLIPVFAIICALGAIVSLFGDLAASAIKRDRKIKDYGTLIPGHGGIMDRFDSVIFTAPVIYALMLLVS